MGDMRGFSKLSDQQLHAFSHDIMSPFADVLSRHGADVEYRNTWGDALFAVISNVPAAARCALEIQEAMATIDLEALGLPPQLAFRLSGHVGPVIPHDDPILGAPSFMGAHVSRTARIEPVTPPGAVYVTEAFAAALELANPPDLRCDYVGHLPAAKDYGRIRMYNLCRRAAASR
jgi:class 3 adenylate cyclase